MLGKGQRVGESEENGMIGAVMVRKMRKVRTLENEEDKSWPG